MDKIASPLANPNRERQPMTSPVLRLSPASRKAKRLLMSSLILVAVAFSIYPSGASASTNETRTVLYGYQCRGRTIQSQFGNVRGILCLGRG